MKWQSNPPQGTGWKKWFAWHDAPLETTYTGNRAFMERKAVKKIWLEHVDRRKIVIHGGSTSIYIYREIGSDWDMSE